MTRRVLVVDDDPDLRELARMCLEVVGGFNVDTSNSGLAALAMLEKGTLPDGLLLDVMMPGLDGLATVARLRQSPRTRTLPVVLLTAKNLTQDQAALDRLGIRGVVGKPFDPMALPSRFSELLGWRDPVKEET